MKRYWVAIFAAGAILGMTSRGLSADNKKLAQTGFQFLSVISDARAAGLAGAVNSLDMGSSALFFNPAAMAHMTTMLDISASRNDWIADIGHNTFSLAFNPDPAGGKWGVLGISVQDVDYGEVEATIWSGNTDGYRDIDPITPEARAIGVGYAKALSTQFSVGGQVRWVTQNLGSSYLPSAEYEVDGDTITIENDLSPMSFDFGTLFKTGYKSLIFGMSVRHFSKEIEYAEEGFQLPLVFTIGASMNLLDFIQPEGGMQSLLLSVDATHYRSHPEQVIVGLDYTLMNMLSLRCGYVTNNDEDNVSFGVGVTQYGLQLDYAYTPFGVFDKVQRMTARFSM
ncbi:PorV/PorQ family protein [bacterium]|nr:PorV/PorQ family protein [bacterium]